MPRERPEWIGSSDDAKIPERVKLRVWEKWQGRCHLTGRKINPGDKWQVDHIVPIILGGRNEESNLAPILTEVHKAKTREEVGIKSKVARTKAKHLGLKEKRKWPMADKFKRTVGGKTVPR